GCVLPIARHAAETSTPDAFGRADQRCCISRTVRHGACLSCAAGGHTNDGAGSARAAQSRETVSVATPDVLAGGGERPEGARLLGGAIHSRTAGTAGGADGGAASAARRPDRPVSGRGDRPEPAPAARSMGRLSNPETAYLPQYDPWLVYGAPVVSWPGWYPYPGLFIAEPGIVFGVGFGIGFFAGFGWGWGHWGCDWGHRTVVFNHN